jgi:hypothetical protein
VRIDRDDAKSRDSRSLIVAPLSGSVAGSVGGPMSTTNVKRIANDSLFCEARAEMERIIDRLMSREVLSMTLSEVERLVGAEGNELLRELMQAHVDLRAAQEQVVEVVGADGVARTQVRKGTRTVETPHGEVRFAGPPAGPPSGCRAPHR